MVTHTQQLRFLLVLLIGTSIIAFFIFNPFLSPIILAAIFSVVLYPLYERMLHYLGNRKGFASLLTVLFSLVCILIPLALIGTLILQEVVQLYQSVGQGNDNQYLIATVLTSVGNTLNGILPGVGDFFYTLSTNIDTYISQGLTWAINHLGLALSGISSLLLSSFIFLISFYYLLLDGPRLKQSLIALSPLDDKDDGVVFDRLKAAVNSVVRGSLLIAVIQGTLTAIGFAIFGIPNPILWGALTVIAALIPGIGTSLVLLPGIAYLFIVGSTLPAIGLIVWGVFAVGLVDNMLYPTLVGRNLQLHPLLVLLSVLGGIGYFGPIGIFLGPITISLLFAFISIYSYFIGQPQAKLKLK